MGDSEAQGSRPQSSQADNTPEKSLRHSVTDGMFDVHRINLPNSTADTSELRDILDSFYDNAFTETEQDGKLDNSMASAIAAIEALIPKDDIDAELSAQYDLGIPEEVAGFRIAIDQIHKNFNGKAK